MPNPTPVQPLPTHPFADLFPLMDDAALNELAADIRANGLRDPIVIYQGKVLDGRNRLLASQTAGIDPTVVEFEGNDAQALDFVISRNLRRRHLNDSQRAMVAADIATMRQGERTDLPPNGGTKTSQADAAEMLNVSKRNVERATVVKSRGAPELKVAVKAGEIPVSAAANVAREPVERQREFVKNLPRDNDGKVKPRAKGKASTEPGGAMPKQSKQQKQHQAAIDHLTATMSALEQVGYLMADDIAAVIVANISEHDARKIAEAIVALLDAGKNKTRYNPKNIEDGTSDWQKPN